MPDTMFLVYTIYGDEPHGLKPLKAIHTNEATAQANCRTRQAAYPHTVNGYEVWGSGKGGDSSYFSRDMRYHAPCNTFHTLGR